MCETPGHRVFLVVSNLAFLGPILYLAIRQRQRAIVETAFVSCILLFSTLHHWCDQAHLCGSECFLGFKVSYSLDVIFSNLSIPVILFYGISTRYWQIKLIGYSVYAITVAVLFSVRGMDEFAPYAIIASIAVGIVVPTRIALLYKDGSQRHFFDKHFHWKPFVLAVLFGGVAFMLFGFGVYGVAGYWIAHSLWHIFAAIGLYFALCIVDPDGLFAFKPLPQDDVSDPRDGDPDKPSKGTAGYFIFIQ